MALVIGKSILSEGFWMSYLLEGPRRDQNLNGLLLAQCSRVEQFAEREQWERLAAPLPCSDIFRFSATYPHCLTCMWKRRVVAQELHSASGSFILPVLECRHGPIEA